MVADHLVWLNLTSLKLNLTKIILLPQAGHCKTQKKLTKFQNSNFSSFPMFKSALVWVKSHLTSNYLCVLCDNKS